MTVVLDKIEALLYEEFKRVPFHNLFMLNSKTVAPSTLGGTCSDKVLHFKKVLADKDISTKLQSAFINGIDCHRMLSVNIERNKYFIDVGSGWPSVQLFPAFEPIEYTVFGMIFKTEITTDNVLIYHKTDKEFNLAVSIPFVQKSKNDIMNDINNRYSDTSIYPFYKKLRFSKIIDNAFYFIKGDILRVYSQEKITETRLTKTEIRHLITNVFKFDLGNCSFYFP